MPSFKILLIFVALTSLPAHAYLDPLSGGIIIQAIVAAVGGCIVFIKLNWQRLKSFFGSKKHQDESDNSDSSKNSPSEEESKSGAA